MSFDWSQYLNVAQELAGVPGQPSNLTARRRSAISRAYYAAFISARNYMLEVDKQVIPVGANPHEYVQRYFERSPNLIRQRIGEKLVDLRRARNRADYDNDFRNLTVITQISVRSARQIINDLKRL